MLNGDNWLQKSIAKINPASQVTHFQSMKSVFLYDHV
jgi:hypothetical protein